MILDERLRWMGFWMLDKTKGGKIREYYDQIRYAWKEGSSVEETEKKIQDAMTNLMKNRTSLIIAHRLSTIQDADVIVVMDNGRVVETGNHETLLAAKGRYYELYMTQFAGKAI